MATCVKFEPDAEILAHSAKILGESNAHESVCPTLITVRAASSVEKVAETGTCNFPTDSCKRPIMCAQDFNFAPKSPIAGFLVQHLVFWTEI